MSERLQQQQRYIHLVGMGGGQSTGQPGNLQAQAEIARLKAELAKATAQVGALSAQLVGPANAQMCARLVDLFVSR